MVRLASRSFLHLLPEVAGPTFDYPFYAQVLRVNDDNVTFRSLDGGDGVIPRSIALRHVVPARAVHAAGELSLLRRPVTVAVEGFIHYGQVTTFEENRMTVDSNGRQFAVSSSQASSVPPIVALLLQHAEFSTDERSTDDLEEIQTTIMNPASTICRWINPSSGRSAEFPLQHALDFAYFVDGGRAPVPNSVGRSFCEPPPRQRQGEDDRATDEALELFDPFVDDDGPDMTEHVPRDDHTGTSNQNRSQQAKRLRDNALSPSDEFQHQPSQQRRRVTYQSALDKDASIVEMLRDDPDLLDRFFTIRQQRDSTVHHALETTRGRTSGLEAEPAPPRIPDQTSKYAFAPRQEQKYIHDQVTAAKHKGKSPNVFVCGLVRSSAAEFKALPGVCTRLYDIRFGTSLEFPRMSG
ncbi:hypothetical protein PHMEG_00028701 [Phytophthora megakarya]|uniref:Uncharacterized protein n=1 Tax=Phytophthora megakarya TaxID=4795 RepID=A0A225V4Z9_9STRA|nr:hypothetical protein PHMEG_00028701 [Phytophthora megakarya]